MSSNFFLIALNGTLWASQVALVVKNPPANVGDTRIGGSIPGLEDPLEESRATHCSVLAWRIPRTEEPSRLQPIGSNRVRQTEKT